ncbi:MAG: membrane protein insertion efficiency factor YidD [candidate division Zixibacteria bacterium]|nr:membrane protein insertion efficiency factor YidD [candidate division Zixibacteria bacterium]
MIRIILLGFLILPFLCRSDLKAEPFLNEDINLILKNHSGPLPDTIQQDRPKADIPSELSLLGGGIIKIYQTVVSSQDIEACNFEPSCSRFAAEAIRRGGFIKGVLLTADRLSRCHLFARPQVSDRRLFHRPHPTRKIYDPPEIYLNPPHHE